MMKKNCLLAGLLVFITPTVFAGGFDAPYDVYQGDFDSDGDVDIYVRERPQIIMISLDDLSIPIPRFKVAPFVLLQQPGGAVSLRADLTGLNIANRQASAVALTAIDVNLDGELDAVLTGVVGAGAGANDQIVFADSEPGQRRAPVGVRAIDAAFKSFVKETAGWLERPGYFFATALQNGWYTVEYGAWSWGWWSSGYLQLHQWAYNGNKLVADTEDPYVRSPQPASCSWGVFDCRFQGSVWQMYVYAQTRTIHVNLTRFNQQAIAFANQIGPAMTADDLVAGSPTAQGVDAILQNVLGRTVLRGVLTAPDARLPYEATSPSDWLGDGRLDSIRNMITVVDQIISVPPPAPIDYFESLPDLKVVIKKIPQLEDRNMKQVRAIVLHRTGANKIQPAFDKAKSARTGTHYYVDRDGTIYQTASLHKTTIHAGMVYSRCIKEPTSCTDVELQDAKAVQGPKDWLNVEPVHWFEWKKAYPKRYPTNSDSVGIEVVATLVCVNPDLCTKSIVGEATAAQKDAIKKLVEALQAEYGLTNADVYHHDRISRKTFGEGSGLGYD